MVLFELLHKALTEGTWKAQIESLFYSDAAADMLLKNFWTSTLFMAPVPTDTRGKTDKVLNQKEYGSTFATMGTGHSAKTYYQVDKIPPRHLDSESQEKPLKQSSGRRLKIFHKPEKIC